MNINKINEEIGTLLFSIEEQFAKILEHGDQAHVIEVDIALGDLQKLYSRFQVLRNYMADKPIAPLTFPGNQKNKDEIAVQEAPASEAAEEVTKVASTHVAVEEISPAQAIKSESAQESTISNPAKTELPNMAETAINESTPAAPRPAAGHDWQRTFEAPMPKVETQEEVKRDLLQEREKDFVPTVKKVGPKPDTASATAAEAQKKESLFDKAASLYDKLAKPADKSLASAATRTPISNIKAAIGINEKFTYLKELFKNKIEDYNEVLEKLNNFENYTDAEDYFQEQKNKFKWDPDSKSFQGLAELMARRYLNNNG